MQQALSAFLRITRLTHQKNRQPLSSRHCPAGGVQTPNQSTRGFRLNRRLYKSLSVILLLMAVPVWAYASSVSLKWTSGNSNADGYRVFLRKAGATYNYSSPTWQGTTTQCTLQNLSSGQTYYAVVRSFAGSTQSANSNEVKFTASTAPLASTTVNYAPVAEAGADQAVSTGATVFLDGSKSSATSGSITSYAWTKTSGPAISLSGANTVRASFKAPSVSSITTLTFQLKVTNSQGLSDVDTCQVTVVPATSSTSSTTQSTTGNVSCSNMIWMEAEDGDIDLPMQFDGDSTASSGAYLWVPEGDGNSYAPSPGAGSAHYTFDICSSGTYRIWARVLADSGNSDSFFAAVDNSSYTRWNVKHGSSWTWDLINAAGVADPLLVKLNAGTHSLTLLLREDGTKIDRILITSDAKYVPQGQGSVVQETTTQNTAQIDESQSVTQNAGDGQNLALEAESGVTKSPMRAQSDSTASSGAYVWVPQGSGNSYSVSPAAGSVKYTFHAATSGTYRIWARVLADSGTSDSFFAAMDNSSYTYWNVKHSSSWTWDLINAAGVADPLLFKLNAGTHTLTLLLREDGTKIDKLIITTDAGFVPK
jgi:K319L-like, PKD domain/Fibronectin type III domain